MFKLIVLLVSFVGVKGLTTLNSQNCTDNRGYDAPINLYIEGCEMAPCALPQLQDAIINIIFRAPRTMRSMTTLAGASVVLGSFVLPPIAYPLGEQGVTCNFLENTYCPIVATEVVQYKLSMFIASFMAVGTNAIVEFYVVDQDTNPVFCVRVPISVAPAINSNMEMTANSARSSKDVN